MSASLRFLILVILLGLVLPGPLAGAAAPTGPDTSAAGAAAPHANGQKLYLPLVARNAHPGIYGRVTFRGTPVAGDPVYLRFFNGGTTTNRAMTLTDADGYYQFTDAPSLAPDQYYYVRYAFNTTRPNFIADWFAPVIRGYSAGQRIGGGDFDVSNVPLVRPLDGGTHALPVTFEWKRRGIPGDNYAVWLEDAAHGLAWTIGPVGDVSSLTLNALPEGANYGVPYTWRVRVFNGDDSYGFSFEEGVITLLPGAAAGQAGVTAAGARAVRATPRP